MNGLGDLFDEADAGAARAAGGARLAGEELGEVHTRVRRAHARRSALRAGLAAVAVVIVGAGTVYGLGKYGGSASMDGAGGGPGATAGATVSPSASPSPSVTPMPAFAGTVTVDPHLPDAMAITPEVWASAGPGWALVSYREAWLAGDADDAPLAYGPQVIYLVSPQGDRYELTTVPGDDTVSVLAWEAGAVTAPVTVGTPQQDHYGASVDLTTGNVRPNDGYGPYIWSLAFLDDDGSPVWRGDDTVSAFVTIAPDGGQQGYAIPDTVDGVAKVGAELGLDDCVAAAPGANGSPLVTCGYGGDAWPTIVARASDDTVQVFGEGNAMFVGVTGAANHVVAGTSPELTECPTDYVSMQVGKSEAVPGSDAGLVDRPVTQIPFGAVGSTLVWALSDNCYSGPNPMVVIGSDLEAGTYVVLVPLPVDRPAGEAPTQSVTGVAVAH